MLIVTTMSYDELGQLIRNKEVSLNNDSLVFGQSAEPVKKYLIERLGGTGYVVGIRGRINNASAKLLSQLDKGLVGNRIIIEAPVDEDEAFSFTVEGIEEATEIIAYGLPDDVLYEHLENITVPAGSNKRGVEVICVPYIKKNGGIRITSLHKDTFVDVDAEGITFIKLKGEE